VTERVWTADADMPWNKPKARRQRESKPAPVAIPPVQKKPAPVVIPPVKKKSAPAVPLHVKRADRGPMPGRWQELAPKFSAALAVDHRYAEALARDFHRLQERDKARRGM